MIFADAIFANLGAGHLLTGDAPPATVLITPFSFRGYRTDLRTLGW